MKKHDTFEKEVKLRLHFENKLNSLFANYRDLNARYEKVCIELNGK